MTTPVLGEGYAPPAGLSLPVDFNFLNPIDAIASLITGGMPAPLGAYMLGGGTLEHSLRNFANPDLPLVPIGSPTINAVGAVCNGLNGFNTGIPETAAFSMLAIVKANASSFTAIRTGVYGPQIPRGVSLGFNAGGHSDPIASASTDSVAVGVGSSNSTGTGFLGSTDWIQLYAHGDTTDVTSSSQHSNTRYDGTPATTGTRGMNKRPYALGANDLFNVPPVAGVSFEIVSAMIWNSRLGDTNRNALLAALRTWFNTGSGLGITTL